MKRFRALTLATAVAALLAVALSTPVFAYTTLKQSGATGEWGSQGKATDATCGYSAPSATGAVLHWIRIFPFHALAASGHSSQKVSWTVSVQRSTDSGSTWKTIKTAKTQMATATQSATAVFANVQLSLTGKLNTVYRAVGVLHWLTNGTSTGLVKVALTEYGAKFGKHTSDIVMDNYCSGLVFD